MQIIGNIVIEFDELESTNSYSIELLKTEKPIEGTVFRAINQTSGRGQRGNTWQSNSDNLSFSVILYPKFLNVNQQFILNKAIALAIRDNLSKYTHKDVFVKWPNDIYIENKKVAGILIENSINSKGIESSVIGVGLNVNQKEFDPELTKATSLGTELNDTLDLKQVLTNLLNTLNAYYLRLRNNSFEAIENEYIEHLYQYGQFCVYKYENEKIEAKIVGVNANGKIQLENLQGKLIECGIKELVFC